MLLERKSLLLSLARKKSWRPFRSTETPDQQREHLTELLHKAEKQDITRFESWAKTLDTLTDALMDNWLRKGQLSEDEQKICLSLTYKILNWTSAEKRADKRLHRFLNLMIQAPDSRIYSAALTKLLRAEEKFDLPSDAEVSASGRKPKLDAQTTATLLRPQLKDGVSKHNDVKLVDDVLNEFAASMNAVIKNLEQANLTFAQLDELNPWLRLNYCLFLNQLVPKEYVGARHLVDVWRGYLIIYSFAPLQQQTVFLQMLARIDHPVVKMDLRNPKSVLLKEMARRYPSEVVESVKKNIPRTASLT